MFDLDRVREAFDRPLTSDVPRLIPKPTARRKSKASDYKVVWVKGWEPPKQSAREYEEYLPLLKQIILDWANKEYSFWSIKEFIQLIETTGGENVVESSPINPDAACRQLILFRYNGFAPEDRDIDQPKAIRAGKRRLVRVLLGELETDGEVRIQRVGGRPTRRGGELKFRARTPKEKVLEVAADEAGDALFDQRHQLV